MSSHILAEVLFIIYSIEDKATMYTHIFQKQTVIKLFNQCFRETTLFYKNNQTFSLSVSDENKTFNVLELALVFCTCTFGLFVICFLKHKEILIYVNIR